MWLDPSPQPGPPLEGDIHADVIVVGAGYTGLWAAIALRERGADVVVLERCYAGFGASGRNAGHLTATIGKDLPTLLRWYGHGRARGLLDFAAAALEHVETAIVDRALDCDYAPRRHVGAGIHRGQQRGLERTVAAARAFGVPLRMLHEDELDARRLPRFVACGYLDERGGVLDPGKYVRALRQRAIDMGARVFESSPADAIGEGATLRVETPRGAATAPLVVLATDGYTGQLGWLNSVVAPLYVSDCATAPLSDEQRQRVGWDGGESIYTTHAILEGYRLTVDNRIVLGARHVRWPARGRALADQDAGVFAALEATFRRRFPELNDVAIEHFWTGPNAITTNFLPAIGRTGSHSNIVFGVGFNGHGIAQASYTGLLLAKIASGENPGHPELFGRRLPMPPEPVRTLAARGILAMLSSHDRFVDRRAQPRVRDGAASW